MSALPPAELGNYQLRLEGFEGPLDVLLQLIERRRLDISDLSLVAVTDGFLEYIDQMDNPPARLLAEFAGIAARLIVLKSRSLLPRDVPLESDESVDDLTERLREYQRIKRMAAAMRDSAESGWRSFGQHASAPNRHVNVVLETPPANRLRALFLRALSRQPAPPKIAPIRPVITVADMARRLLSAAIRPGKRYRFFDVVTRSNREETVAGFVALLSLWARRELQVSQRRMFDEIEFVATTRVSEQSRG